MLHKSAPWFHGRLEAADPFKSELTVFRITVFCHHRSPHSEHESIIFWESSAKLGRAVPSHKTTIYNRITKKKITMKSAHCNLLQA